MSVIRIAITGGPCAGKTTVLNEIRRQFGGQVVIVPEVASILLGNGFPRPGQDVEFSERWVDSFQNAVLPVQINMEQEYLHLAEQSMGRIMVCDRGVLDGAAYLGLSAISFLKRFGLNEGAAYARYDAVIHLESVAVSDPDAYLRLKATNPARYESADDAARLDAAIKEVWGGHPRQIAFSGGDGIEAVTGRVVGFLSTYLDREVECKYLLAGMPDIPLGDAVPVCQGYLQVADGELRVRRMGDQYYITIKSGESHNRQECERTIDAWAFEQLWRSTEGRRIEKERYFIPHGGLTIELDRYLGRLDGLVILECEFPSVDELNRFAPPDWAAGCIDVTTDPRYKNRTLATEGLPR